MLHFPRWKVWTIALTCLLGVLLAIPSFLPKDVTENWPNWLKPHINMGLDLAGGSQLLLEAETGSLERQRLDVLEDAVQAEARRQNVNLSNYSTSDNRLAFNFAPDQREQALQIARGQVGGSAFGDPVEWDVTVEDPDRIVMTPTSAGLQAAITNAMSNARGVIDRRINAFGTLEPTIIQQGAERILVQVPGIENPDQLRSLIGKTARLEFKEVLVQQPTPEAMASGRAPTGVQYLEQREGGRIAVRRRPIITGDELVKATAGFNQNGEPDVSISFNSAGGTAFGKHTREHVNEQFAIVLDNVVISAPSIREPILGGQASIAGSFTVEETKELAIALQSGRLPVELTVVDERSVSPELGADSIRLGVIAASIGAALVIIFMLLTYGRFGLFAVTALVLNVVLILGWMALFNATLTLPGIAGFVLTIGAAVDANIIINERIREELRKGRSVIDAIDTGWKEASTAILDANVTNAIAGAMMFIFGSGPIKGFAVVLVIGIITSAFTAITVARAMVAVWARRYRPKTLVL